MKSNTRHLGALKKICSAFPSTVSKRVSDLISDESWDQLVDIDINPLDYENADQFSNDYLIVKFLSKFEGFKHKNLDPKSKAMKTFYDSEEQCRQTNKRFKDFDLDPSKWDPLLNSIFVRAKRKISHVLMPLNLDVVSRGFAWGPGATTSCSGNLTSAYNKFRSRLDVTSNALIMGNAVINSIPSWVNCQLQTDSYPSIPASLHRGAMHIVRGNEVVLVPKNAKTHRVIAKEPTVNSFLQKGPGSFIRRQLLNRAGIDLRDQTRNQALACLASSGNLKLATIDLKAASDTISTELVRFLLPHDWFCFLDAMRSKQGKVDGNWLFYEKFSSMGNSFTFELESLIFWALSKATIDHSIVDDSTLSVYGDDLIVPSCCTDRLIEVLNFAGFTVNTEKSFFSGPFRESCGADFFNGTNVRPIFLKKDLQDVESHYRLANAIKRLAHRRNYYGCDARLLSVWEFVVSGVPKALRYFIPDGCGDTGLVENFDLAVPSLKRPKGAWEGYLYSHLIRVPIKRRMVDEHAGYTVCLMAAGSEEPFLGEFTPRKSTRLKKAQGLTRSWVDLGPWV